MRLLSVYVYVTMNSKEKNGCEAILNKIDYDDLMSLKDTVTKRQIAAENRNDAIRAIITYSESSEELLRRKKIKREIIFQYLADNNVSASVSAEKHQLITKALQFWGVRVSQSASSVQTNGTPQQSTSECQTDRLAHSSSCTQATPAAAAAYVLPTQTAATPQLQLVPQGGDVSVRGSQAGPVSTSGACVRTDQQKLGETFVSWFYKILNSHNPTLSQTPEDFGPHHFWNDVKLHLLTVTTEQSSEQFEGGVMVSQRFLALVREEQLLFNPNLTLEGVQVKSDPHGLLVVMVCGTIHRANDCLGVFQQMFGLVGDPRYDNNWKIKMTKLRIQSSQVTTIPKLQDSDNSDMMSLVPSSRDLVS